MRGSPLVSNLSLTKRIWKDIWSLKVPNRVKTLIWRAGTDSLPSKANLMKRKVVCNDFCPECKSESESSFHALLACCAVAPVWELKFAWLHKLSSKCNSFLDVIQLCQDHSDLLDLFAMTVSLLWARRNQLHVGEKALASSCPATRASAPSRWLPPPKDWMKINFN